MKRGLRIHKNCRSPTCYFGKAQRMEADATAVEKPVSAAEEKFNELMERLSAKDSGRMTPNELESFISSGWARDLAQASPGAPRPSRGG